MKKTAIMDVQEVARRLNLPEETIHRWIRQGKIPMQTGQGTCTISSESFRQWAEDHQLRVHAPNQIDQIAHAQGQPLFDGVKAAMQRGGLFYDVPGKTRSAVLQAAVARVPHLKVDERTMVNEALIERERLASTGIGHGIALPHPRANPGIGLELAQITTCFLAHPVDFEALDGRPVSVLMVLLSPSTPQHLLMLSRLSYHLRDAGLRSLLLAQPDRDVLFSALERLEKEGETV